MNIDSEERLSQIKEVAQNTENFRIIASVFSNLSDATRVRIFWLLCHCEQCVADVAAILDMSSPAVSHHLKTLKNSGLITGRRKGKEVCYKASQSLQSRLLHEMIEKVMQISCPDLEALTEPVDTYTPPDKPRTGYQEEQIRIIRKIHDELSHNLDRRLSVEELSKKYLMNPTTLKALFKEVYGNSIAAHIREHRMEEAARLLKQTSDSIADIAAAVGYSSQSKFTRAFKDTYHMLPKDFR